MCEFCEKAKNLSTTNSELEFVYHTVTIENDTLIVNSFDDWDDINKKEEIKINFCPICGRKLN